MNGIETQKFEMSLDKYSSLVAFYNEIENHYIKNCDEGNDSVFVNFAKKFMENKQNFTCDNVCVPLYFEPIANTITIYCSNGIGNFETLYGPTSKNFRRKRGKKSI